MKKSYSIFLSILFCFLFCSLSAQDAQLNAASRKVIIEAPAEPGTHLEVAYRPAGSFFPSFLRASGDFCGSDFGASATRSFLIG